MTVKRTTRRGALITTAAATLAIGCAGVAALGAAAPARAQSEAEIVARVNAYLNNVTTLVGDFVQIAPDGVISEGRYLMRRPGRLRFEYEPPNPTIVIADGFWVAVIDEKDDRSIDRYPLSETPLYLLLKEDVDLGRENAIRSVETGRGQYRVTAVDPTGEAQGAITMVFDANPIQLRQWVVTDPQGLTTTIALRTVQEGVSVDMAEFNIPDGGSVSRGTDR